MPLGPGVKLGPYEVLAPLGAGGMGEVYRARDTRLDRTVAIKVLPDHLAANPDLRLRFEREARAVSSLNHPHICALFDVGQQDGTDYLVMEYVEGETLADRLGRGPLPTDQVLRCGIEIADALDKAHRQGIVHRDLKPGNVMLTKAGAKLLDFGLAKLQEPPAAPAASVLSAMATGHRPLTEAGTILGTFQYMAPEQLEGNEADARTDLFAFGTVLYEMATGRRAFTGKSQASLIAAILSADPPPLSSVQPLAPPALERLVKVCLAKDPDDRLQTAHDVMQELKWIVEAGSAAGVPAPVAARRRNRERVAWVLVGLLALVASTSILFVTSRPKPAVHPTRFLVSGPEGASSVDYALLSPDGRNLAFSATVEGVTSIWVRPLDSLEAHPLRGTEGVDDFMWSGDSASVAFVVNDRLNRLALSGGPSLTICSMKGDLATGDWSREGILLLSSSREGVIYRVSASGGAPAAVTAVGRDAAEFHTYPTFLPDGRHFLYMARRNPLDKSAIYLASLDSPERRLLVSAESQALYTPPGYLLFVRGGTLMAQPFDGEAFRVRGEAMSLADEVPYVGGNPYADFSVATNGTLAYRRNARLRTQLTWLDRAGRVLGTIGAPGPWSQPALSPDGTRLVVLREEASRRNGIWLFDLQRGSSRLLTEAGPYSSPLWSRDGRSILFGAGIRTEPGELRRRAWDGTGSEEVLLKAEGSVRPGDVSPDGRVVAFTSVTPALNPDVLALPLAGERKAVGLVQTPRAEGLPQFSPDGRWIAYTALEGTPETYVEPYPPGGGRLQVSVSGGTHPRWRADGREIFYLSRDGTLMAVDIAPSPSGLRIGQPLALFRASISLTEFALATSPYVVAADGRRFLFASRQEGGVPPPVHIVLNWAAELQR